MRHTSFLEVNLGLLAENFSLIQDLAPKAKILPMVKADAYGNGLIPISQFLSRDLGANILGVASLGEAMRLVSESPDLPVNVWVFSDNELRSEKVRGAYLTLNITPVIHHRTDLEFVLKDPAFHKIPLILKLNTGMNRLGLLQKDLEDFLPQLKKRGIKHLMTHFARSSQILSPGDKTHKQHHEFLQMKKILMDSGVTVEETSLSNSGAIEQGFGVDETMVRPGLMMYGPPSVMNPTLWKGHQISRFVTRILSVYQVKKGTPVGYGVNVADKDSLMAILPIGYGDGFLTFYSGGKVKINGIEGKIFGRINMDMSFIQFDPQDADKIREGMEVEVWNHDNSVITEFAARNKCLAYEVMCSISGRIPRIYKVK